MLVAFLLHLLGQLHLLLSMLLNLTLGSQHPTQPPCPRVKSNDPARENQASSVKIIGRLPLERSAELRTLSLLMNCSSLFFAACRAL